MSMRCERVMTGAMYHAARKISGPNRIRFKSERVELDPKAKELLTKYRKGMIWKKDL
jgi:hypothetical protein